MGSRIQIPSNSQVAAVTAAAGAGASSSSSSSSSSSPTTKQMQNAAGVFYNQAPWLIQPSDFVNLDVGPSPTNGVIALPATSGTPTPILTYAVPNGRYGKIIALGIDFIANGGAAYTPGALPAELTFSITIDGRVVNGYENFQFLPGSVTHPTYIAGLMLKENQTVIIGVVNLSLAVTTQSIAARILGYLYSKKLHSNLSGFQT